MPASTFSNTRGTASSHVGWKEARSPSSVAGEPEWATWMRAYRQMTWTAWANTWASGRKSRVRDVVVSGDHWTTSRAKCSTLMAAPTKLPCVITAPFGRPVVPEV